MTERGRKGRGEEVREGKDEREVIAIIHQWEVVNQCRCKQPYI